MIEITPHPAPSSSTRSPRWHRAKRPSKIASTEKRYPRRGWTRFSRPPRIESTVSRAVAVAMNHAEKGERYARTFRKAGVFLGKGNIARAVEILKEGEALANSLGDARMAKLFADEIARVAKPGS